MPKSIGTTVAPMIAEAAWDFGGAWPSYGHGCAWGAVLTWALLRAPEAPIAVGDGRRTRMRVVDVLPRLPDYVRCFALIAIPAVATTMAIHFLRTATNGVQSSIYVVYLNGIGLTGTSIGTLSAAIEITSSLGSLFAGRAMRLGDPQGSMLSGTVLPILHHTFFGGAFALLFAAQASRLAARGCPADDVLGVGQALGPHRQSSVVGLRQTMNRLAALVISPLVGSIADYWGARWSFVILGAVLIVLGAEPSKAVRASISAMSVSAVYLEATVNTAAVARHHGVEAFVNMSQMRVAPMSITETTESPQHKLHWLAEQAISWSGLPVVTVRPTIFLEGFFLLLASGIAGLNIGVTRQAAMVAYVDDFKLIMLIALGSVPLLLLLRDTHCQPSPRTVPTSAAASPNPDFSYRLED